MLTEDILPRGLQSRPFGRKGMAATMAVEHRSTLADDLKLFVLTFAGGFLFVTLYLA
jgi:hypothetical protein